MKLRFNSPISVVLAMSFGIVVLMGYFFGNNLAGETTMLGVLREYLLRGAILMSGFTMIVGIINLGKVHVGKVQKGDKPSYSLILLISLILTIIIGLFDILRKDESGGVTFQWTNWVFQNIQLPIETSLMAVLTISLTYAAARLIGKRMTIFSGIFVGVLLILILGAIPQITNKFSLLSDIRSWVIQVPAVGGARGILLGVGLGTIATGLRILIGRDRPYKG